LDQETLEFFDFVVQTHGLREPETPAPKTTARQIQQDARRAIAQAFAG